MRKEGKETGREQEGSGGRENGRSGGKRKGERSMNQRHQMCNNADKIESATILKRGGNVRNINLRDEVYTNV